MIMSMKSLTTLILAAALFSVAVAPVNAASKAKPYPLKTCVVSDEKLGGMGDPFVFTYKEREMKLCCKGCLKDFHKDPAKYVKKVETAEKKKK